MMYDTACATVWVRTGNLHNGRIDLFLPIHQADTGILE